MDEAVAARVARVAAVAANPASVHAAGVWAAREVERARERLAAALGDEPETITFTSGATEANNLALKGVVWGAGRARPHLAVSAVEHPSVLEPARWLADAGLARLTILPVTRDGVVEPSTVASALDEDTVLVSVQHANNETGVIHPVEAIGDVCRRAGVTFHVDASQSFGKLPLPVRSAQIDLLTASGHKLHGPKGVGLLYARAGLPLVPLLHGGGHERGLRGGTLNAPAIAGFGEAIVGYTTAEVERIAALRERFEAGLRRSFPTVRLHGGAAARLPTISNFAIPGQPGKALFLSLNAHGCLVSASSACHSTALTPSPVLLAMGASDTEVNEAVRVSFGRTTTAEEVERILNVLVDILPGSSPCP
jgi:cysteine desulfurase